MAFSMANARALQRVWWTCGVAGLLAACPGTLPARDAGTPPDAGLPMDAGTPADAGREMPRRVLAVVFEPKVNGQRLSVVHGWSDPYALLSEVADWWGTTTSGRVQYRLVDTLTVETFPAKEDGFVYDAATYGQVIAGTQPGHVPDGLDYAAVLAQLGVCERVNAGEVDELWMMGGPYFGFYESRLAGPGAYEYNSPPLRGTACQRLLPIMGFNYERALPEAIHDFGHRAEATLTHLFGGWSQDRTANAWERFGLVAAQSPTLGFSGCGSIHYPPTATRDYEYDNASPVQSACDDFLDFPALSVDPAAAAVTLTCAAWGCSELGFYAWWFRHLPGVAGKDAEGRPMDWLHAVVDPQWLSEQVPSSVPCFERTEASGCERGDGRCQWADCAGACIAAGLPVDAQACTCLQQPTVAACDATPGCAYYFCSERCLARGTDVSTGCR